MIYWFTGQPGAGKTTLADWLATHYHTKAINIDGDDIREIFDNKDYSEAGRRKNIELAQNMAHFLHHKGYNVFVSLVSPYKDQRESFKEKLDFSFSLECLSHFSIFCFRVGRVRIPIFYIHRACLCE
jgi:adenylylsulfate kinase